MAGWRQHLVLEKEGIKGTWENFKHRFSFGGQVVTQQEIIYFRTQPFTGNNLVHKIQLSTLANAINSC